MVVEVLRIPAKKEENRMELFLVYNFLMVDQGVSIGTQHRSEQQMPDLFLHEMRIEDNFVPCRCCLKGGWDEDEAKQFYIDV